MARAINSMGMIPFLHFLCDEMSSLIKINTTGNAKMVAKAFSESTDDDSGGCIMVREGKSISRTCTFSQEDGSQLLPRWKRSNVVNLLPGVWLVSPRNGVYWELSLISSLDRLGTQQ